jgi:hypothetical protein
MKTEQLQRDLLVGTKVLGILRGRGGFFQFLDENDLHGAKALKIKLLRGRGSTQKLAADKVFLWQSDHELFFGPLLESPNTAFRNDVSIPFEFVLAVFFDEEKIIKGIRSLRRIDYRHFVVLR